MSLSAVIAAISDAVTQNLASLPIVPTFGPRFDESAPPHISFTPTREDFAPAQGQGGDYVRGTSGGIEYRPGSSKALLTRQVNVEVMIWGVDRDATETMINAFFSALHDVVGATNYGALGASWEAPYELDRLGAAYVLTLQLLIPVSRIVGDSVIAPLTDVPVTPTVALE